MDTVEETNCEINDDKERAKVLGEVFNIPADGLTEVEVARKACSTIRGIRDYAEHGSDAEVLAAIRGFVAWMVFCDEEPDEDPDEELDDEAIDEIIYGDLYKIDDESEL